MKEITVETTGNFQLVDRISGKLISHDTPTAVPLSPFVQERLELGHLREVDVPEQEQTPLEGADAPEQEQPRPRRQRRSAE